MTTDIPSRNCINLLLSQKDTNSIFFIFDEANKKISNRLKRCATTDFTKLYVRAQSLADINLDKFENLINEYDRVVPIYDINPTINSPLESNQRQIIRCKIHQHFNKVTRLCDLSLDFDDFFNLSHSYFVDLHHKIISAAETIKEIRIINALGTDLIVKTESSFSWVNIDGITPGKVRGTNEFFYEAMLGEVATHSSKANGIIQFTGSILFSNHFNWQSQLITEPISLDIQNGRIININAKNTNICKLLEKKFSEHEFNSYLSEIGIGTHPNILLKGKNLIFEERHAGAHLGFGGMKGSDHMDFIFSDSIIKFDNKSIFDGHFHI